MSLRKNLRLLHEARQKEIRDRAAREDYVRSEGRREGRREGLREGRSEGLREGRSEGRREGEDRLNSLNCRLIADKRFEDLERATRDKEYRERLYNEYEIY